MRRSLIAAAAVAFAATAPAFAKEPVKMTEQQMDQVTAGLITVVAVDLVDINNNTVQAVVPVNAAAAVAVLGDAVAVAAQNSRVVQNP